ncbi:hypothetical protein FSP39_013218 [Pinctada imbricata]|uniref:Uncharacterized protein n=1 Tax=Pinctada imbricata TaxID=66713 RepID=A0AA88YCE3_PINIB|nr:hypothetical protein FSP39_013218 [Pinctada imbricata]
MAYYPGNRGNFPPPPFNPFTPPPEFIMQMLFSEMLQKKHEAQAALNRNQLPRALSLYSDALNIAQNNFPGHDEIPKLLSNRALGYWRCAQAYKGLNDHYSALNILVLGLAMCTKENVVEEKVTFLAEIVSTVMQVSDDPNDCLDSIDPPEEEHIQIRVLQRLASNGCWEGVSLLLIGEHRGPISNLDECFSTCPTQSISVGSLILSMSDFQLRKWGQKLIITLLRNGASYTDMEYKIGKPVVHIGIQLSLRTGTTDLLKYMLKQYLNTDARKNAVDKNRDSAFHFLVRSGKANSTLGETLFRLLLNNGCNPNLVDAASKRPIDYVRPVDQAYSILNSAQKVEDENVREKLQKLKDEGNKAHREGNNYKANEAYTKGLQLIQNNGLPPKEAAVFLSNRSAVQSACGNTKKALDDAELSVLKDPTWHKVTYAILTNMYFILFLISP